MCNHKDKVKFECGDCGCYFWVESRNHFKCPNCEKMEYENGNIMDTEQPIDLYKKIEKEE